MRTLVSEYFSLRTKAKMQNSFRHRIMNAGIWSAGGFVAQRGFQLASNLLLTRLLFPEAFGLMALANTLLTGLYLFSDVGIKPAIVQNERGDDEAFLNTAWTIQIFRGFALWAVACILAYPAAHIYGHAILWPLISALGATAAINGFASTSLATCERRLDVRRLTIVNLSGQIVTLVITAFLAWQMRSVWALAYGGIAGALVTTTFSFTLMPTHRHRLSWEGPAVASLLKFGRWIFLSTAATFIGGQGLRALQGILLSPAELGFITIAQTLAWMPTDFTAQLQNMVGFPALSEMRKQSHAKMAQTLSDMRTKVIIFVIPGFVALALLSGPIVHLLYDDRYAVAGRYMAILAFSGAVSVIPLGYQSAVLAIGDTRLHFYIMVVNTISRIFFMFLGYYIGSINGMLVGIGVGAFFNYLFVASQSIRLKMFSLVPDVCGFAGILVGAIATWLVYAR